MDENGAILKIWTTSWIKIAIDSIQALASHLRRQFGFEMNKYLLISSPAELISPKLNELKIENKN